MVALRLRVWLYDVIIAPGTLPRAAARRQSTDMSDDRQGVSRRRFLTLMTALSAAAALQACGVRRTPTPSPVPTRSTDPVFIRPPLNPSATPTGTPGPTATGEPPTATPTPRATPFPPGPPTRLGVFVTRNVPEIFALAATRNLAVIKTLEHDVSFVSELKQLSPDTLIVGRPPFPDQLDLESLDPLPEARRFVDQLLPLASDPRRMAAYAGWEAANEPVAVSPAQMQRLADFEAERTRLLAAEGIRSVVGNFGTGHPDLALWPQFYPALEAVKATGGYLGLHEYSAPEMWFGTGKSQLEAGVDEGDEGWLTLRYRKAYRNYLAPAGLAVPLIMTECGIDGLVQGRPGPQGRGWRDFVDYWAKELRMGPDGAGNYVEQLAWYDEQLRQDDYVKGAAIYALVASGGWESYELLGEAAEILDQYLGVHPLRA